MHDELQVILEIKKKEKKKKNDGHSIDGCQIATWMLGPHNGKLGGTD